MGKGQGPLTYKVLLTGRLVCLHLGTTLLGGCPSPSSCFLVPDVRDMGVHMCAKASPKAWPSQPPSFLFLCIYKYPQKISINL